MGSFSRRLGFRRVERRATTQQMTDGREYNIEQEQVCKFATENSLVEPASASLLDDYFEFCVVYLLDKAVILEHKVNLEPALQHQI